MYTCTNFGTREEMTNDSVLVARNFENTKLHSSPTPGNPHHIKKR